MINLYKNSYGIIAYTKGNFKYNHLETINKIFTYNNKYFEYIVYKKLPLSRNNSEVKIINIYKGDLILEYKMTDYSLTYVIFKKVASKLSFKIRLICNILK